MEGAEIDPVGISGQSYSYSLYQIAILLRNKALEQRGISVIMDQDPEARSDKLSSHVVCFGTGQAMTLHYYYQFCDHTFIVLLLGGDNPVAVSRWSIHQYTQNECTLLVDRLLVLGESVGRRFAYRCLYNVLHAALQQHVQYKQVDIYVPELQESQWVIQKLQSFGFVHVEQMHNSWHGLSSVNMRLLLNSPLQLTPGAPSLEDLLGFLLQKISA